MSLSEPYPTFSGVFPNYDPTQLNNQGVGTVLRGDEARRERYNNYNVTMRRQLPANFSTTVAYIGAYGTRLTFMPLDLDAGNEINRMPFDAIGAVWRPAVQQPVGAAADSAFRCRIPVSPAPCSRRCGPIRSSPSIQ